MNSSFNGESNNKLTYSSFLGEKDEQEYEELLPHLLSDNEFSEIWNEMKLKDNIFLEFHELSNEKKCEILIKSFFIVIYYFISKF